jgi:hypothetical protein
LPEKEGPYEITCRANMITALQENRMRWVVSNYKLSNWKTQRKILEAG